MYPAGNNLHVLMWESGMVSFGGVVVKEVMRDKVLLQVISYDKVVTQPQIFSHTNCTPSRVRR